MMKNRKVLYRVIEINVNPKNEELYFLEDVSEHNSYGEALASLNKIEQSGGKAFIEEVRVAKTGENAKKYISKRQNIPIEELF